MGGGDRDALDAVYQLVHRLNGSSAIYGFESLRRAAAALEMLLAEAMEGAGPAGTFAAQLAPLLEGLRSAVPALASRSRRA